MDRRRIILRDADGLARIRYTVGVTATTVYVTDTQGLTEIAESGDTLRIVGFPRSDVFRNDPDHGVKEGKKGDWARLKNWS